jgi:hypothetical protein
MGGGAIASVRETLQTILRALPLRCRFNIVGFGRPYSCFRNALLWL